MSVTPDNLLEILHIIVTNGSSAVILLLLMALIAVIRDRSRILKKLEDVQRIERQEIEQRESKYQTIAETYYTAAQKELDQRESRYQSIADAYFKAATGMTEALSGLKVLLAEINGRLIR